MPYMNKKELQEYRVKCSKEANSRLAFEINEYLFPEDVKSSSCVAGTYFGIAKEYKELRDKLNILLKLKEGKE